MNSGESLYIWQADDWPRWRYDGAALVGALTQVSHAQGLLLGRLIDVGMALRDQASLAALTDDVLKTSAIEGEALDVASARWPRSIGMWKAWWTWCWTRLPAAMPH